MYRRRLRSCLSRDSGKKRYMQYRLTIPAQISRLWIPAASLRLTPALTTLIVDTCEGGTRTSIQNRRTRTIGSRDYRVAEMRIPRRIVRIMGWQTGTVVEIMPRGDTLLLRGVLA